MDFSATHRVVYPLFLWMELEGVCGKGGGLGVHGGIGENSLKSLIKEIVK